MAEWLDNIDTLTDYAITYAVFLTYYGLMEGRFGFTLGKLVTGTRVVDAQGRRITLARGMLRSLCRLILLRSTLDRFAISDSTTMSSSYASELPSAGGFLIV